MCNCYQAGKSVSNLSCGGCKHCQKLHDHWERLEEVVDDVVPLAVRSVECATEEHVIDNAGVGNKYVLIIIDQFTRWVEAFPVPDQGAETTAKTLVYEFIYRFDVPEPPILTPTDLKEVMEETTVNLICSSEAPCPKQPPTISWSNIPESAHITTQLQEKPDKTQSVFSYMTFKASYKDHRKSITCTATYPRNSSDDSNVESTMTLKVLFSPEETHITIDPSDSVSAGTVTLTCKSKASPNEMNYTW
ncbi:uncharacterized protein LOC107691443 [Sinocyclocheilus anshuiensis]|uniref:uncharacterized protein LOC107691443 n=1 Tax=Sinocyclocheilus anshuiensis TaxID=1608454 RepID=UPI0007BA1C28|nr:PREDICTED: uncharacterized protein LOC107691443 [Sinocyclocheilus anshuiensis]